MSDRPHRRLNPLTGRHVLVSPHRALRPWQGAAEPAASPATLHHDPDCYLCPGNRRASGAINPDYRGVWAFDNDFPALLPDPTSANGSDPLFMEQPVRGRTRVLCFSPDHSAGLGNLSPSARAAVVGAWCEETATLGRDHASVQVFENRGEMMGCSNPHPHGQIWATDYVPDEVGVEDSRQRAWLAQHGGALLDRVAEQEADGERCVEANGEWLAIVPFWATWPFETLVLPRRPAARLPELDSDQRLALADLLGGLIRRYDALFAAPFPYSMGWHGAPFGTPETAHWRVHAHIYPPLLRSASVRKFMVGFEMLAEAQRDLTPEQAAARLRAALP